jgi:hypothetical protein
MGHAELMLWMPENILRHSDCHISFRLRREISARAKNWYFLVPWSITRSGTFGKWQEYEHQTSNIKPPSIRPILPTLPSSPSFLSILPLHPSSPSRPRQPKCQRHLRLALRSTSYPPLRRFRRLPRSRAAKVKAKLLPVPRKLKQPPTMKHYLQPLTLSTHFRSK